MEGEKKVNEVSNRAGALKRGLSMANTELVAQVRQQIESCERSSDFDHELDFFEETPNFSFILPDITILKDKKLVSFLKNDLIDTTTYSALTKAGVLNWWADRGICRKLFPLSTVGDGNCLLHAVSLAMWGFNDRLLTLRKALHRALTKSVANGSLKRRWMYHQWLLNMEAGGLCFSRVEWETEWQDIVQLASEKPRSGFPKPARKISLKYSQASMSNLDMTDSLTSDKSSQPSSFESLEEFHVFALAHVLRRPIIVLADTMLRDINGEPLQPINFGGIYLPIECDPKSCCKYPLILGYDSAHFAALVPADGEDLDLNKKKLCSNIPLVNQNLQLLPIQFLTDPGSNWALTELDSEKLRLPDFTNSDKQSVISMYLDVVKLNNRVVAVPDKQGRESRPTVTKALENISTLVAGHANPLKQFVKKQPSASLFCAKLDLQNRPKYYNNMIKNYIESSKQRINSGIMPEKGVSKDRKCINRGCNFFGSEINNYLCSGCYKMQLDYSVKEMRNNLPSLTEERSTQIMKGRDLDPLASNTEQRSTEKAVSGEIDLISFSDIITADDSSRPSTTPDSFSLRNHRHFTEVSKFGNNQRMLPTAPYPSLEESFPQPFNAPQRELPEKMPPFEPKFAKIPREPTAHSEISHFSGKGQASLMSDDMTAIHKLEKMNIESDNVFSVNPSRSQMCKTNGCKFYGTIELNDLCSSCYARQSLS